MKWLQHLLAMYRKRKRNPIDENDGLSPLHVACLENNVDVVRQLLNDEQIDVNRSVDQFAKSHLAGQSPLHLALISNCFYEDDDDVARLEIVDLLLKNGAHVNVHDPCGETPLHKAVQLGGKQKFNILKRILEAGANVNAIRRHNCIPGVTALDYLLRHGNYSAEQLELFIEHGCRLNGYNPIDEAGYVAVAFVGRGSESEEKRILFKVMLDHPHAIEPDELGRTVVHSLVAHPETSLRMEEYVKLIDELAEMAGCDVDDRDKKGRTAMFLAARHGNVSAIEALLIAGADVNITDSDGDSAFDHLEKYADDASVIIARHVRKLELLRLEVSRKSAIYAGRVLRLDGVGLGKVIRRELELAKSVKIGCPSLSLRDFFHEVDSRAATAVLGNEAFIREFFRNFKDERFAELRSVLRLQYKKIVARSKLIEPAAVALDVVSGCSVLCAELIVRFLRNDELKRLIEALIC